MEVSTNTEMITKDNAAQWLPLVQALAEGKQLQCIYKDPEDVQDLDPRLFQPCDYRIKPEPRRFWVNVYDSHFSLAHRTRDEADNYAAEGRKDCIEVAEVLKRPSGNNWTG